jgi:uncharacterized SAM-binding protein YcdF (DUF218 family)
MAEPGGRAAIVVLGCALDASGAARPALRRRTLAGAALFQAGQGKLLVLSGGGPGRRAEAEAMAEIARGAGVPDTALLLETGSANTFENAVLTAALLRPREVATVTLVSDAYHLPRARFLFRIAGLAVGRSVAAPPEGGAAGALALLREGLAWARTLLLWSCGVHRRRHERLARPGRR